MQSPKILTLLVLILIHFQHIATSLVIDRFLHTATRCTVYIFLSYSGVTVSIEETEIIISEETGGQICIVLENVSDGLERDVLVTLNTTAGTAGTYNG